MNKRLSSLSIAIAAAAGLVLGGCVQNLVPVEFYGLCGFPDDAAICAPPAGKCGVYQNGQLYLYYQQRGSLDMVAEFHNQRVDNTEFVPGGVNSANAEITEFHYKFSASPPVALAARTVRTLTTPIASSGTSTLWIPVIPRETVSELRAGALYTGAITVELYGTGRFGDGSTFETAKITIPTNVGFGLPPATTCADPTASPVFCPSEFQTHSFDCVTSGSGSTALTIGGTITGLTGTGLVLATPGQSDLSVTAGDTTFQFGSSVADGSTYNVTIVTQPTGQTCTVFNGSGTVAGAPVSSVSVSCI
jgi:hypothetical protein